MAIMIPAVARDYNELSLEGIMFNALSQLPDNYYVVHSFNEVYVDDDNVFHEAETDFLIFCPSKGLLFVEAKAGEVHYKKGNWLYGSGKVMKHGGPFRQADQNKWDLFHEFEDSDISDILNRCKLLHAVWFPSVSQNDLYGKNFPPEMKREITLTVEALFEPQLYIDKIYELETESRTRTDLSDDDVKKMLSRVICPSFDIFLSSGFDLNYKKAVFNKLLKEQARVLDYLTEQNTAVINGAAGTGKTMLALEKARRHAENNEKVLFLCYNAYLNEYFEENFQYNNVEYYTITGFVCKLCNSPVADYAYAAEKIREMYIQGNFPYKHVIVDEGQDFGKEEIDESEILNLIFETVTADDDMCGSFYLFYDQLQMVNSKKIPKCIDQSECRLTLHTNCRNTENIALTSLKPLRDRAPKVMNGAIKGNLPKIYYCHKENDVVCAIYELIDNLEKQGVTDIVILTCKTEKYSCISGQQIEEGRLFGKKFTTCRKFKGLEADAIILIDITSNTFEDGNIMQYYVGASRARLYLNMITTMDEEDCTFVLTEKMNIPKIKNARKQLAVELNSFPIVFRHNS